MTTRSKIVGTISSVLEKFVQNMVRMTFCMDVRMFAKRLSSVLAAS